MGRAREPAKGGDQSKKKDKASKDNAAAEAAAAAAAEIEALQDPQDAGRKDHSLGDKVQKEGGLSLNLETIWRHLMMMEMKALH
jgi:hypothetical protein